MKVQLLNYPNIFNFYNNTSLPKTMYFCGGNEEKEDVFVSSNEHPEPVEIEHPIRIPLYEARNISGIHCPVCGTKMLSKEKYKQIVAESGNLKTTAKVVEFLKNNQDFITNRCSQVLSDTKRIPNYKKLPPKEYLLELSKIAEENRIKNIHRIKRNFSEFSNTLSQEQKEIFDDFVSSINDDVRYLEFREKLNNITADLMLDVNQVNELRRLSLKSLLTNERYCNVIKIKNLDITNEQEAIRVFISNIFWPSTNTIHSIEKYENHINNPNNSILICRDCEDHRSKNLFFKSVDQPNLKENLMLYLKDISLLNGSKLIDIPHFYTIYVCRRMDTLTKGKIKFDEREIKIINKAQYVLSRHDEFAPIKQTEVDVPCAECGSTMLPYAIKKKITEELSTCKQPYEFAQIMLKYDKYIGYYARDFADIFIALSESQAYNTTEEFLKLYKEKVNYYLETQTQMAVEKCRKDRAHYSKLTPRWEKVYDRVLKNVSDYIYSGEFKKDYDYYRLTQCFRTPDLGKVNIRALSTLKLELKTVAYKHTIGLPNDERFKNTSSLYNIAYGLFCSDSGTADHYIAASSGGENTNDNLIGLCKGCNRLKGTKSVLAWYDQHPLVRKNFPNHLHVVDDMAKNGDIVGYDDWAYNMAEQTYALTMGQFDIRNEFPKK